MSTTHDASAGRSSSSAGEPTAEAQDGGEQPGQDRADAARMRDGAMARTAQGRDLAARKARALRGTTAGLASGSAAGATAGRGGEGGPVGGGPAPAGSARPAPRTGAPRTGAPSGQRPPAPRPARRGGPRRVRLTAQRVDPWSVLKISFLVSVALGIASVVMIAVLWTVLSGMNVFSTLNDFLTQVTSGETGGPSINLEDYLGFTRVTALAAVLGILNVFLLTALATLTAFLYNICAALVGGAQLTLSDE